MGHAAPAERYQWAIWPPAMALLLGVFALYGFLAAFALPTGWRLVYGALALVFVAIWLLPRLGFVLWIEDDAVCCRCGLLRHRLAERIPLHDIAAIERAPMPDRPRHPWRTVDGVTLYGGNFTPALNVGLWLTLRDGRRLAFCLPQPERFANGLRQQRNKPIETP
jgi:hypothetical protein